MLAAADLSPLTLFEVEKRQKNVVSLTKGRRIKNFENADHPVFLGASFYNS